MQVHNPVVPFLYPIDGKLVPGSKIKIIGWPKEKCKHFLINLKFGPSWPQDEIAFHMNIHFKPSRKTNQVCRNTTWTSAGWGPEEADTPFFPFLTKQTYKIEILCERARFRVSIDDKLFCVYTHRLPLAFITHLEIAGDTEVSYIEIPRSEFVGVPRYSTDIGSHSFKLSNLSVN